MMKQPPPSFKDLFSSMAENYSLYRPTYPEELFQYLAEISPQRELVWDCGTGNGQAAMGLAQFFDRIIASDASPEQLRMARSHERIRYVQAPAEKIELPENAVDLVTAAQSFHWFNHNQFFKEAQRVLRPQGHLAIWCYSHMIISPEIDPLIENFYSNILGKYWEKERILVEEGYRNCPFPFHELTPPSFSMKAEWDLEHLIGHLGTWSALKKFNNSNSFNPLDDLYVQLKELWPPSTRLLARWNLDLRIGSLRPG